MLKIIHHQSPIDLPVQVHKPIPSFAMRLFMNALSEKLVYIEQLVHEIINQHDDPLYKVIDQGNGLKQVLPTHLANAISLTVRDYLGPLLEQFPIHEFNPYINVFIKNVLNCHLLQSIHHHEALKKQDALYRVGFDYEIVLEIMTRMRICIAQIKQEMQGTEFKNLIYKAYRTSKKNYDGMMRYIDSLFEHHYQLLVVRVDLGYHLGNIITCQADIATKYWEAKHDFQHLLNNAKANSLFEHVVGYVWSLEYGPDKGFHYHLMLFFDGAKVRQDVTLSRMVGDYWSYPITGNRGLYYNCNARKNEYSQCGIGMIDWKDTEKRNNLKNAAAYLIKVDHYARMLAPDNGRVFGRGEILPPRTEGPGRPRSVLLVD